MEKSKDSESEQEEYENIFEEILESKKKKARAIYPWNLLN